MIEIRKEESTDRDAVHDLITFNIGKTNLLSKVFPDSPLYF